MEPFLLTPQSLQHLAQTILAGILSAYLFTRSHKAGSTRDLAFFFAVMTLGLALLFLDQVCLAPGAKAFIDLTPAVFQVAGVLLLAFAYRFPDVRPRTEARWVVRAAWLAVLVDLVVAGPNVLRSLSGSPNPSLPFRLQLVMVSLAAIWIVAVFLRRALRADGLTRRERGALGSFAGLGAILLVVCMSAYLANLEMISQNVFLSIRAAGFLVFLFAFVVVHLNASPEPSELMAKLVGLSLVATLLALALAAALVLPMRLDQYLQAGDPASFRAFQHRQAMPFALLMLGLPTVVLALFPLLLRAGLKRPLGALLEGVRRVNDGDLTVEVPVRMEDEIGYLAHSFNSMVRSVREAVETRERVAAVEREFAVARRIQEDLLPESLPNVAGIIAAARLIPAETMSGDFYDAVLLDDGLALLAVDVSGHGVPAALIAAMAKLAFSQSSARAADPAALLTAMNETLTGRIGGQFFTACCVFLDPVRGLARLGNAGHPPVLLLRNAQVQALKPAGPLAGLLPDARYGVTEIALTPGDRILIYTDGVTECCSPEEEEFGLERLGGALREGAALSPDAFADHLLDQLRTWSGREGTFEDDVTVLVADFQPQPGRLPGA
jgi:serine phosphatase RsbU (regulator of sigma subunit)